jgi:hypothetical protein
MRQLAAWAPMQLASYTWMPVALWCTERLIRAPTPRRAVVLAAVLALQLLPGFPQLVLLTYQLIALRVAWAVVCAETPRRPALVLAATGALLLAPLLVGVQLLPSMEVWRESVRAGAVPLREIGPGFTWPQLLDVLRSYAGLPASWLLLALGLGALGARRARRRRAIFWWAVAAAYVVLSLGPGSFLFAVYERLPLGSSFRGSARLLWVVALALAMAAALGAEEIAQRLPRRLGWAVPALVVAAIVLANFPPVFGQRRGDIYGAHRDLFAVVRERATPQDRTLIVGRYPDTALMSKSAELFDVADAFDFEPLAARAYADFFTYVRTGRPLQTFADWIWVHENTLLATLQRPLFDLTAARYLLVAAEVDRTSVALPTGLRLLGERDGVRLYENEQALPRARWLPTVRVVTDEAAVLPALAAAGFEVRRTAIVDHAPASGFLGSDTAEAGSATIVVNDPERLVVRVQAPARGFLFLADTFYPGWTARSGGRPVEILRADGAFRAVEVPAGEAEVEFTYRPRSLLRGVALSVGSALVTLALLWRG